MQNDEVGKLDRKGAGEIFHDVLEKTRTKLVSHDAGASGNGSLSKGYSSKNGTTELSDGFVLLVALIAERADRDPREVLGRLRAAEGKDTGLSPPENCGGVDDYEEVVADAGSAFTPSAVAKINQKIDQRLAAGR